MVVRDANNLFIMNGNTNMCAIARSTVDDYVKHCHYTWLSLRVKQNSFVLFIELVLTT